jgi:hypothetical protein
MINDEDAPTGRPAGSLAWAGLFGPPAGAPTPIG